MRLIAFITIFALTLEEKRTDLLGLFFHCRRMKTFAFVSEMAKTIQEVLANLLFLFFFAFFNLINILSNLGSF